MSASARNCHLVRTSNSLTRDYLAFLDRILADGTLGDLVLQQHEAEIASGEWFVMFINGKHIYIVLKVPRAEDFRINGEFGGGTKEIPSSKVPKAAVEVSQQVLTYLYRRLRRLEAISPKEGNKTWIYARINGIIHDNNFVLMEVEVMEPHMWLEKGAARKLLGN